MATMPIAMSCSFHFTGRLVPEAAVLRIDPDRYHTSGNFISLRSSNGAQQSLFGSWALQSKLEINSITHRSNCQKFQALINATKGGNNGDEILMVDPVEAKRLADIQMQKIKAKEKLKMQRKIEAINGAWAMIGLTVGLIIEGQTGNGILAQLAGYWGAFIGLFFR